MGKNVFEVITEYGIDHAVNSTLMQDDEYKRIQANIDSLTDEFDKLDLTEEQRVIIEKLLSAYNENGAYYGKLTYQQGTRDCASLLVEIGLIKDGKEEELRGDIRWQNKQ